MTTGLYIHVPFCARACPYCDFDFQIGRFPPIDAFLRGLAQEVDLRSKELPLLGEDELPQFSTVYIGGGTPSLLGEAGLTRLCEWIRYRFPGSGWQEWTVEINPEHASPSLFSSLHQQGVQRISLGVQTLSAQGLRQLGRVHTESQALQAIEWACAAGLCINADLIVGWPHQEEHQLHYDLTMLMNQAEIKHISVYALSIEESTPWQKLVRRRKRGMPNADQQATLLILAEQALVARGFTHYEVSNYCSPGQEGIHNLGYWTWRDYVGIGPSASSAWFLANGTVMRQSNVRGFSSWLQKPGFAQEQEILPPIAAAVEGLWTGLRRLPGFVISDYLARFSGIDQDWLKQRIDSQLAQGNVELVKDDRVLRVCPERWLWHDAICADLMELS